MTTRSCLECRRRKIRCDRKHPCSYCIKVRIECTYPSSLPEPSGSQQRPELGPSSASPSEPVAARIQRLEEHVKQLEARLFRLEGQVPTIAPTDTSTAPRLSSISSAGGQPTTSEHGSFELDVLGGALRLSPPYPIDGQQVSAEQARSFWEAYLSHIDPLLKIVDHQYVEDTLLTWPTSSTQGTAVLRAIFFACVTSKCPVSAAEYQSSAKALEAALQSARLLNRPSTSTLQALTIYLICGRVNMEQNYLRTMLSLLVQLATKLRLDRDPDDLGYLQTESENRRRLWWHIVALDVRTAEACGSDPLIQQRQMGTRIPSMVTDAALRSNTLLTPTSHAPCSFYAVMGFEMAKVAREVLFSPRANGEQTNSDKASKIHLSEQLHQVLFEKYTTRCKCVNSPVCRLTVQWCTIYAARQKILVLHSDKVFLQRVTDEDEQASAECDLTACTEILEQIKSLRADATYSRWSWLWQNVVEWDVAAVALCTIATGTCSIGLVKRAWTVIDLFFAAWTGIFGDPAHQRRWDELSSFRSWVRATQPDGTLRETQDTNVNVVDP